MAYYWSDEWTLGVGYTPLQVVYGVTWPYDLQVFVCTAEHTATANDEPGVGANWADYWDDTVFPFDEGNDYIWAGQCITGEVYYQTHALVNTYATRPEGPVYASNFDHTAEGTICPENPGYETYWTKVIEAGAPPPTANPWYGYAVVGSIIVANLRVSSIVGSYLVQDGDGKLVFRIGAFEEQHVGFDAVEDVLSDAGVTFV